MSIIHVLGESAVRTLVLGLAVALVLRVLRVQHVRLAKRAWTAVLVLAFAMPALVALHIPAVSLPALWSVPRAVLIAAPAPTVTFRTQEEVLSVSPSPSQFASASRATPALTMPPKLLVEPQPSALDDAPALTIAAPVPSALRGAPAAVRHIAPWQVGLAAYLAITAAALFRTLLGLVLAARLWRRAQPFAASGIAAPVRLSVDLRSPATIGNGILLPLDAIEWDDATLRATLAHEAEHVREGDFYLQLAAALHLCFFWISPLAWWLRPQLARLSETICDRAAIASSGDGLRYAELLLRFASAPYAPAGIVAMAHTTGLRERIDRLIADPQLAGSFRSRRGQAGAATALLATLAVAAAVTVHIIQPAAVVLAAPQAPAAPAASPDPVPQTPTAPVNPAAPSAPAPAAQPSPTPAAQASPAPPAAPADPDSMPAPTVAVGPDVVVIDGAMAPDQAVAPMVLRIPPMPPVKLARVHPLILSDVHVMPNMILIEPDGTQEGGYAVVTPDKDGKRIQLRSWSMNRELGETDTILKQHPGGAILFRHEGKTWIIDNPDLVKKAKEAFAHVDELGKQQGELGAKQGMLGDQQGSLGELEAKLGEEAAKFADEQAKFESENFHFDMPKDFDKDIQTFTDAQVKLGLERDKLSKEQADALEKEAREAHDRFDKDMQQFRAQQPQREAMEKQIREQTEQMRKQMEPLMKQMREQAEKQRELGRQQGEFGRQQMLLSRQQREASHEADRQVHALIDQAVKDGSARPLP